jgi:hypothetical protein
MYCKVGTVMQCLQLHHFESKKYDDYVEDYENNISEPTDQTQQLLQPEFKQELGFKQELKQEPEFKQEPELKPKLLSLENNDDVYISITEEETSDDWMYL